MVPYVKRTWENNDSFPASLLAARLKIFNWLSPSLFSFSKMHNFIILQMLSALWIAFLAWVYGSLWFLWWQCSEHYTITNYTAPCVSLHCKINKSTFVWVRNKPIKIHENQVDCLLENWFYSTLLHKCTHRATFIIKDNVSPVNIILGKNIKKCENFSWSRAKIVVKLWPYKRWADGLSPSAFSLPSILWSNRAKVSVFCATDLCLPSLFPKPAAFRLYAPQYAIGPLRSPTVCLE